MKAQLLGQIIRDARQKQKPEMTQLQLANMLGFKSPQFVSLFERGLSDVPMDVLGKCIVILNLNKGQILSKLIHEYRADIESRINLGMYEIRKQRGAREPL